MIDVTIYLKDKRQKHTKIAHRHEHIYPTGRRVHVQRYQPRDQLHAMLTERSDERLERGPYDEAKYLGQGHHRYGVGALGESGGVR